MSYSVLIGVAISKRFYQKFDDVRFAHFDLKMLIVLGYIKLD